MSRLVPVVLAVVALCAARPRAGPNGRILVRGDGHPDLDRLPGDPRIGTLVARLRRQGIVTTQLAERP